MEPRGPFLNLEEAAAYCGYAPTYFTRLIKGRSIKRYGPSKTRFAQSDLDLFMADHNAFALTESRRRQPRKLEV